MAKAKESTQIYQLKITLRDTKPPVWRQVEIKDCSLTELHYVIQTCMGWDNCHMHSFEIGGKEYGEPDPDGMSETEDEGKVKLSKVATRIKKFSYTYDFGDNWEHTIQVEKVLAAEPGVRYPRCTDGKRACPPEDCGGSWGYENFLEAVADPNHPEHEEMADWYDGEFDPEKFDIAAVNKVLR